VYRGNNDTDKLHLMALLLQDAANDWYDGLDDEIKASWRTLKDAFLQRFEDTQVLRWRRTNELHQRVQGQSESVDDYITAMRKLAKSLGINGDVKLYDIQRGLRPEILERVMLAEAMTIDDVLKAACVAETADTIVRMTTTLADTKVDRAIPDASVTRQQATEDFRKLRETTIQSTMSENGNVTHSLSLACTPTSTATTTTTPQRRIVNAVDEGRQHNERQRSSRNHQNRGPSNDYVNVNLISCTFCESFHEPDRQFCKAVNLHCYNCGMKGHIFRTCQFQSKENAMKWSTQCVNQKQNWNVNFGSAFDYNQSQSNRRNIWQLGLGKPGQEGIPRASVNNTKYAYHRNLISVTVKGRNTLAIIDTGADISFISLKFAQKCNMQIIKNNTKTRDVYAADGRKLGVLGKTTVNLV